MIPAAGDGPPERAERREAVARSREALQALKPQELRALSLLAEGYSYIEIGEITGFSQTKINRCLAEGRERFRSLLSRSEDGSRCEEMRPLLSAFCDGEASSRGGGGAARAPARLRQLPGDPARLPGGARRRGGAGAGAAALPLAARPRPRCARRAGGPLRRRRSWRLGALAGRRVGRCPRSRHGGPGEGRGDLRRHRRRRRRLRRHRGGAGAAGASATGRRKAPALERRLDPVVATEWSGDSGVEYETAGRPPEPEPAPATVASEPQPAAGGGRRLRLPKPPAAPPNTRRRTSAVAGSRRRQRANSASAARAAAARRESSAREARLGLARRAGVLAAPLPCASAAPPASRRRSSCARSTCASSAAKTAGTPTTTSCSTGTARRLPTGLPGDRRPTTVSATPPAARWSQGRRAALGRDPASTHHPPAPATPASTRPTSGSRARRPARAPGQRQRCASTTSAPGPAQPLAAGGWVAGDAAAMVTIEHPAGPQPVSGIRGYAVSVDRGGGSAPCAGRDRCSLGRDRSAWRHRRRHDLARRPARGGQRRPRRRRLGLRECARRRPAARSSASTRPGPRSPCRGPGGLGQRAGAGDGDRDRRAVGDGGERSRRAVHRDRGRRRRPAGRARRLATRLVSGEGPHRVAFYARDAAGNRRRAGAVAAASVPHRRKRRRRSPSPRAQDPAEPERIEATRRRPALRARPARGSIARPAGRLAPALRAAADDGRRRPAGRPLGLRLLPARDLRVPGATGYDARRQRHAARDRRAERRPHGAGQPAEDADLDRRRLRRQALVWQRCSRGDGQRRCRREEIEVVRATPDDPGDALRAQPSPTRGRLTSASGSPLGRPAGRGRRDLRRRRRPAAAHDHGRDRGRRHLRDAARARAQPPGRGRLRRQPDPDPRQRRRRAPARCWATCAMRASSTTARIGGAPVVFSGGVGDLGAPIPPAAGRSSCSSASPAASGRSSAPSRPTPTATSATATRSATTTAAASASSSAPSRPQQDGWPYEPAVSRPVFVTGR